MDKCKQRHILRTVIALYLLQSAAKEHKKCWAWERERCKKENEEFIMDSYLIGRITHAGNLAESFAEAIVKKNGDVDFYENPREIEIVKNRIKDSLERANCLAKDRRVCNVEEERKSKALPPGFVYTWASVWAIFVYLRDTYSKVLNDERVKFSKLRNTVYKYHEFFLKDIMAMGGEVEF